MLGLVEIPYPKVIPVFLLVVFILAFSLSEMVWAPAGVKEIPRGRGK